MINRRELLLGTLGLGTLSLTGCCILANFGPSGGCKHIPSPAEQRKAEECHHHNAYRSHLKWYFDEGVSVILIDGETIVRDNSRFETGNFVFISDNFSQPNFTKLPISLLNKGYISYFGLPTIHNDKIRPNDNVCTKPINLDVDKEVYFSLLFSHKNLHRQEIDLLKRTFGDGLRYADYGALKNPNRAGYYEYQWRKGDFIGEPVGRTWYIKELHHLFGQKIYYIGLDFGISKFYTHSFETLFNDDKGMAYEFLQTGEMFLKKAVWAKQNQVPSNLLTVVNGQLLYQGRKLNHRLDRLARLDKDGRLIKPFSVGNLTG